MKKPTRPTHAVIHLNALEENLEGIRRHVGSNVEVRAVVKANAYGHGAVPVAKFLEKKKVKFFGVAYPEEAVELRQAGIRGHLLVFTLSADSQVELLFTHHLQATVSSVDDVQKLQRHAAKVKKTLPIHLKIDTGMNRIGTTLSLLNDVLQAVKTASRLQLVGVFTHFASADERDKTFTHQQLIKFNQAVDAVRAYRLEPRYIHCANSAAILDIPESRFNMVRPGISLYGYYPSYEVSHSIRLKPVMSIQTRVALVKVLEMGETVSYGRRYVAQRKTRIATIPVGYADGVSRLLTGKMSALIHGRRFPVVGTICMDQCMVDVGKEEIGVGAEVVLIGEQGDHHITAQEWADKLGTIPYEICCGITSRVPRIYEYL
ncbi:MAG: alanine racemase [Ignavibacteriales bacterium]|nr:alanine racemase [Ignavibacteriales bacterium]